MSKTTRIVFWILLVIFFLLGMLFVVYPWYLRLYYGSLYVLFLPRDMTGTTIFFNALWLFFAVALILDSRGKKKRARKNQQNKD